jgi:hypothetical protein
MSYKNFNRHELFNRDLMEYHSTTIRQVEDYFIDNKESFFNPLTNMLAGIWDGYLYDNLLDTALEMGIHNGLIERIEYIIGVINVHIAENSVTSQI